MQGGSDRGGDVVSDFEYIVSRNPSYEEIKEEYREEVLEDTEDGGQIRQRIEAGIENQRKHDNLLESTISVFLPEGPIHSPSGWVFLGAEPLSELNVPNADAIFGNPEQNVAVIVECKSGLSRPGQALNQIYDAADAVRDYQDELEENIGMSIERLECSICVPSYYDDRIAREIESHETDGIARERVFVWRLHYLGEEERLDLFTRINTRDPGDDTHDNQLAQILNGGIEITKERQATPSFFPGSHLYRVMEEVFSQIMQVRLMDNASIRHFGGEEVIERLTSQRHLPHYDAETIGARIFSELMELMLDFELVTEIRPSDTELEGDGDFYRYKVSGRSLGTILSNLKERYIEQAVEKEIETQAMERTLEQYDEEQRQLDDY